jgi:hypothetical protein
MRRRAANIKDRIRDRILGAAITLSVLGMGLFLFMLCRPAPTGVSWS